MTDEVSPKDEPYDAYNFRKQRDYWHGHCRTQYDELAKRGREIADLAHENSYLRAYAGALKARSLWQRIRNVEPVL